MDMLGPDGRLLVISPSSSPWSATGQTRNKFLLFGRALAAQRSLGCLHRGTGHILCVRLYLDRQSPDHAPTSSSSSNRLRAMST